jgi:hypothetical protein
MVESARNEKEIHPTESISIQILDMTEERIDLADLKRAAHGIRERTGPEYRPIGSLSNDIAL